MKEWDTVGKKKKNEKVQPQRPLGPFVIAIVWLGTETAPKMHLRLYIGNVNLARLYFMRVPAHPKVCDLYAEHYHSSLLYCFSKLEEITYKLGRKILCTT